MESTEKKCFTDQMGRKMECAYPPKRIISLVPSLTELLFDLGLESEVVGITKFCIHPEKWFREKMRVGGTKNINHALIGTIKPDLIIANKEENDRSQIELLAEDFPVWMSDVVDLTGALDMIRSIGALVGREEKAAEVCSIIEERFASLDNPGKRRAAYLIWNDPIMTVNEDTFIHDMLERCGLENVFSSRQDSRYPSVEMDELAAAAPDLLLLSSEPFPFSEKHIRRFREKIPQADILLVDGEMFSWYGSRLMYSPGYFKSLFKIVAGSE